MKALTTLLVVGMFATATSLLAQSSINGAWKIIEWEGINPQQGEWRIENIQPSLWLFMDGYYSATYLRGDQKRSLVPENATREELSVDEWKSMGVPFVSNAGTYEITASTLTIRPIVALFPNYMDGDTDTWDYRFEGDLLHLTRPGEDLSQHLRFQRLQ